MCQEVVRLIDVPCLQKDHWFHLKLEEALMKKLTITHPASEADICGSLTRFRLKTSLFMAAPCASDATAELTVLLFLILHVSLAEHATFIILFWAHWLSQLEYWIIQSKFYELSPNFDLLHVLDWLLLFLHLHLGPIVLRKPASFLFSIQ